MSGFSVVIPTHNRSQLLRETLESVLAQTCRPLEIIVVDDGSSDDTPRVLAEYGPRIRAIHRPVASGPEVARNEGAAAASGAHLVFLDSDDLLHPQALELYGRLVEEFDPSVIVARQQEFSDGDDLATFFSALPGEISVADYAHLILKDHSIKATASILVVKRSVFESVGGFRNSSPTTFFLDDLDFMLRVGFSGRALQVLEPPTVAYRFHSANTVSQKGIGYRAILRIIRAERQGLYPGGEEGRLYRYGFIGGPALYWVARLSLVAPLCAVHVLISSLPMSAAALAERAVRLIAPRSTLRRVALKP